MYMKLYIHVLKGDIHYIGLCHLVITQGHNIYSQNIDRHFDLFSLTTCPAPIYLYSVQSRLSYMSCMTASIHTTAFIEG